jgi:poly-gamma-glutamate synthesis protein (capsule biosynthesis protein)
VTITISAAGDVTLGGCPEWSSLSRFIREFEQHGSDHSHFLLNVRHIFEVDDLTIVNLEGTLTDATRHRGRTFNFRGPPHFAKILSAGHVNVVSLANNHSGDYLEQGYMDTIDSLEAEGIAYFGNEFNTILEVKGIRIGLFGYLAYVDNHDVRNRVTNAISDLRNNGAQLIIAYYHWGLEKHSRPTTNQRSLGRFTIDAGADLVLGTHPHVIQGIEEYNGKNIVYSLANFCFGGNRQPYSLDTFVFRQTFTFDDGVLLDTNETSIIPASSSSVRTHNNYQPTPAEGAEAERIMQKIQGLSDELNPVSDELNS